MELDLEYTLRDVEGTAFTSRCTSLSHTPPQTEQRQFSLVITRLKLIGVEEFGIYDVAIENPAFKSIDCLDKD